MGGLEIGGKIGLLVVGRQLSRVGSYLSLNLELAWLRDLCDQLFMISSTSIESEGYFLLAWFIGLERPCVEGLEITCSGIWVIELWLSLNHGVAQLYPKAWAFQNEYRYALAFLEWLLVSLPCLTTSIWFWSSLFCTSSKAYPLAKA